MSNYIAIGNSLTAGYASNGLYLAGQQVAYPVLIAQQFKLAGGGDFYAPLFDADQADGTGYLRLDGFLSPTSPILTSVPGSPNAVLGKSPFAYNASLNPDSIVLKPYSGSKINNFGVPGVRVADIQQPGYGWPNSYFGRMLTDVEKATKSYSAKVLEQNPTFFSCWLGNNDVLGYSTAGGSALLATITPKADFQAKYNKLISDLVNLPTKPKGVLANIPDVTAIPFFTTVGPGVKAALPSGVPAFYEFKFDSVFNKVAAILANPANPGVTVLDTTKGSPVLTSKIATLNPITGNYDGDVFFTLTFSPYAGDLGKPRGTAWRNIIKTLVKQFNLPPATENAIWFNSGLDTTQPFGFSFRNPVPDVYVLNSQESATAKTAVADFNQIIKAAADANGLAFVDANYFLKEITKGSYFDAISTNASFLSGGAFSLDGVHLTPRGNALAANEFIKAINFKYNSKITVLNPGQFKGVTFP
jgi:lysophospholipase L1-like esterase